jgi:rfaE bifunctional protein nucleotidyltransferase chain/domain
MQKLEIIQSKIIKSHEELSRLLAYWNFKDQKIVFTNGCFDILHKGHIDYLAKAASLGDVLVLGLNTDDSVRRIKGDARPIQDEESRAQILAAMQFIDAIVMFDEDTPYELIKTVQPDFLVKGSDYSAEDIVGYDVVMSKGGQVVTIDFLEGYSTSRIVDKIKNT